MLALSIHPQRSTINTALHPWPWLNDEALRFDRFMEACLHDEKRGYYARRISGIGARGDFTTAPMLSPALAKAVAAWACGALKATGCRHLIELGPGEGRLSHGVLKHLSWLQRRRVTLHLVERSKPLREKQRALLGKRAVWHDTLEEALAACEGMACMFSNELVDAFPVRRFRWNGAVWQELFVHAPPHLREEWRDVSTLPDSSLFAQPQRKGQIVEVHESYRAWLHGWLPQWCGGRMLTIDYGAEDHAITRQLHGTLRAYLLQHCLTGTAIYENPGRQDLTADVNFTDLIRWSGPWASMASQQTMRDFLCEFARPDSTTDARLLDPDGAGGAFLVLEQKRE